MHQAQSLTMFGLLVGRTEVDTAKFGQANLSKTETHTEAPITQLGRAATSCSIIDHVWFLKELFEPETQRTETTNSGLSSFCFSKYLCGEGISESRCDRFRLTSFCFSHNHVLRPKTIRINSATKKT